MKFIILATLLAGCTPPQPTNVTACRFRYRDWISATQWVDVYRCGTELRRVPSTPVREP